MSDDKKNLMEQYAITSEQKTVYHFKDFKYDNLDDALVYARKESGRKSEKNASSISTTD